MQNTLIVTFQEPVKITYHGESLYSGHKHFGDLHLAKGQTYTAIKLYHYKNIVEIELQEVPGKQFSSDLFEVAE